MEVMTNSYPVRQVDVNYDWQEIQSRYLTLYTGLVSDALEHLGYHKQCMASGSFWNCCTVRCYDRTSTRERFCDRKAISFIE